MTLLEPLKISQQPAKFGGHRYCGSGDILILVCQVTSQDYVIKETCDFMTTSVSR